MRLPMFPTILFSSLLGTSAALADGTEELGPPSIAIAEGSHLAAFGVGLAESQPQSIVIDIPLEATVRQVLVYWNGEYNPVDGSDIGDDTVVVEGTELAGTLIGGPTNFFRQVFLSSFRADITELDLVAGGVTSLSVHGLDYNVSNNGAGALVIYEMPGESAEIVLADGQDLAFAFFDAPLDTTVQQTYTFEATDTERIADLSLFAASVGGIRPNVIEVTVDGVVHEYLDVLGSVDGDLWDTVSLPIVVPAGIGALSVQILSENRSGLDELEASLAWLVGGLSIATEPDDGGGDGCTRTLGYWKTHSRDGSASHKRDATWDELPLSEDTPFFDTPLTWYEILITKPRGSAFVILAHQYVAAVLNGLSGAETSVIDDTLDEARGLLDLYDGNPMEPKDMDKETRRRFVALAGILDDYNNGIIGPGHCDDDED